MVQARSSSVENDRAICTSVTSVVHGRSWNALCLRPRGRSAPLNSRAPLVARALASQAVRRLPDTTRACGGVATVASPRPGSDRSRNHQGSSRDTNPISDVHESIHIELLKAPARWLRIVAWPTSLSAHTEKNNAARKSDPRVPSNPSVSHFRPPHPQSAPGALIASQVIQAKNPAARAVAQLRTLVGRQPASRRPPRVTSTAMRPKFAKVTKFAGTTRANAVSVEPDEPALATPKTISTKPTKTAQLRLNPWATKPLNRHDRVGDR